MRTDLLETMRGRHGRNHAIAPESLGNKRFLVDAHDDRCRIGETGGLDDHARDWRNFMLQAAHEQIFECPQQIATHGTADATRIEHHEGVIDFLDQQVIDTHFAELVDQHGSPLHLGLLQQMIKQRCLSGAKKAGQYGYRNAAVFVHGSSIRRKGEIDTRRPWKHRTTPVQSPHNGTSTRHHQGLRCCPDFCAKYSARKSTNMRILAARFSL